MKSTNNNYLLNLLFLSGYLTLAPDKDQPKVQPNEDNNVRGFVIPNEEVRRYFYDDLFLTLFAMTYCSKDEVSEKDIKELVDNIDEQDFPRILEKFITKNISLDLSMEELSFSRVIESIFRICRNSRHTSH